MKVLISLGMGHSIIECLVGPLTRLEKVQEVLLVRTRPGPALPKVKYFCPPQFMSRLSVPATLYKLVILIYLSIFKKPDLIHSFLIFPHGILAFITGKITRKSISVTLNAGPVEFYGIGGSPLGIDYNQPLPRSGKIFLWMLTRCDNIMVINSSTKEFLISHGIGKNKISILPQPVNTEKFHPIQIPKEYEIISVGRLAPVKHVEVVLKALAIIKQDYPGIRAAVVGDGPSENFLKEIAAEMRIDENVKFLGFREDLPLYYNKAKIFILTSEREGGPLTLTEAMACGIPPVAAKCGIVPDIGIDGVNCIIVEGYNDADTFAEGIIKLLNDDALYSKLSDNAVQTAKKITVEDATQVWENVLK